MFAHIRSMIVDCAHLLLVYGIEQIFAGVSPTFW